LKPIPNKGGGGSEQEPAQAEARRFSSATCDVFPLSRATRLTALRFAGGCVACTRILLVVLATARGTAGPSVNSARSSLPSDSVRSRVSVGAARSSTSMSAGLASAIAGRPRLFSSDGMALGGGTVAGTSVGLVDGSSWLAGLASAIAGTPPLFASDATAFGTGTVAGTSAGFADGSSRLVGLASAIAGGAPFTSDGTAPGTGTVAGTSTGTSTGLADGSSRLAVLVSVVDGTAVPAAGPGAATSTTLVAGTDVFDTSA